MPEQDRQAFLDLAAETYDELVAWNGDHLASSLGELEKALRRGRLKLMSVLLEQLLEERARKLPPPTCPHCGRRMVQEGWRTRWVESLEGSVRLERPYFTCRPCGEWGCALDRCLRLCRLPWSEGIMTGALALAEILPLERAADVLHDLTGVGLSRSALHRLTRDDRYPETARMSTEARRQARRGPSRDPARTR
jgi:hypothetical protein